MLPEIELNGIPGQTAACNPLSDTGARKWEIGTAFIITGKSLKLSGHCQYFR